MLLRFERLRNLIIEMDYKLEFICQNLEFILYKIHFKKIDKGTLKIEPQNKRKKNVEKSLCAQYFRDTLFKKDIATGI